jgi:hypothetical protein
VGRADGDERRPRADRLADIVLPDHEGRRVRFVDLERESRVALVWLCHDGEWTAATTRCGCIAP